MSRTRKHGKAGARKRPTLKPRSPRQDWQINDRRTFGSTEKILRRIAPLWRRLFAKEGRRLDRKAVREGLGEKGS